MPGQLGLEAIHRRLQRELRHVEDPQVAPRISEQDLRDLLRHLRIVRDHELTGLVEVLLAGDVDARGALGTIQLLDRLDPDHVELLHTRTTSRLERRTLSDPALALKAEEADLVLVADPDVNVMLDTHTTIVTSTRVHLVRTRHTEGEEQLTHVFGQSFAERRIRHVEPARRIVDGPVRIEQPLDQSPTLLDGG